MANISYPQFGKIKTVVLPIPAGVLTLDQYKEKYGIDLKEYIVLDDDSKSIYFNAKPDTQYLIDTRNVNGGVLLYYVNNILLPIVASEKVDWDEGGSDGILIMGVFNDGEQMVVGIQFFISQNSAFSYENIKVSSQVL